MADKQKKNKIATMLRAERAARPKGQGLKTQGMAAASHCGGKNVFDAVTACRSSRKQARTAREQTFVRRSGGDMLKTRQQNHPAGNSARHKNCGVHVCPQGGGESGQGARRKAGDLP